MIICPKCLAPIMNWQEQVTHEKTHLQIEQGNYHDRRRTDIAQIPIADRIAGIAAQLKTVVTILENIVHELDTHHD